MNMYKLTGTGFHICHGAALLHQVVIIAQNLKVGMINVLHQLKALCLLCDHIAFFGAQGLERYGNTVFLRCGTEDPANFDKLLPRLLSRKALGDTTAAAAAENNDFDAGFAQPAHNFFGIVFYNFHIRFFAGETNGAGEQAVCRFGMDGRRCVLCTERLEFFFAHCCYIAGVDLQIIVTHSCHFSSVVHMKTYTEPHKYVLPEIKAFFHCSALPTALQVRMENSP